jgi:CheY-like chemotaxis protein
MCKRICKELNGDINCESQQEVGTTFCFHVQAIIQESSNMCSEETMPTQVLYNATEQNLSPNKKTSTDLVSLPNDFSALLNQMRAVMSFDPKVKARIKSAITIEEIDTRLGFGADFKMMDDVHRDGRVLIVDDQIFNIEFLRCQLEAIPQLKDRCDYAENGLAAVKLVRASLDKFKRGEGVSILYKLILLDYSMPLLDGPATSQAILTLFHDEPRSIQKPYIVCLTAFTEKAFEDTALAAGMSEFVSKPISNDQLKFILKQNLLIESGETDL